MATWLRGIYSSTIRLSAIKKESEPFSDPTELELADPEQFLKRTRWFNGRVAQTLLRFAAILRDNLSPFRGQRYGDEDTKAVGKAASDCLELINHKAHDPNTGEVSHFGVIETKDKGHILRFQPVARENRNKSGSRGKTIPAMTPAPSEVIKRYLPKEESENENKEKDDEDDDDRIDLVA